jgi:predicted O-methyltransferase YrrM
MIYNDTVLIPTNYWEGKYTLDLEIPWITPEALHSLFLFLKPYHSVLEFGSGGSTLFFSNRAKNVLSFETLVPWYEKMSVKIKNRSNIELHFVKSIKDCSDIIGEGKFDVILVDACEMNRYDLAEMSIKMINPRGIIVVDNYKAPYCFNLEDLFTGCKQTAYDDSHWAGNGTKLFYM